MAFKSASDNQTFTCTGQLLAADCKTSFKCKKVVLNNKVDVEFVSDTETA